MRHVTITFDVERGGYPISATIKVPAAGDVLATLTKQNMLTGTVYAISHVREVRRRDPKAPPRFKLRCMRLPLAQPLPKTFRPDWVMQWYSRKRRAQL